MARTLGYFVARVLVGGWGGYGGWVTQTYDVTSAARGPGLEV